MHYPAPIPKEEPGLLDVVVSVAENIKILIAGPLFAGLCALGISFLLTPTYQSVAVLQADQATASLMLTAVVLDPVIVKLGLANETTVEEARIKLREQVKTAVGRTDKLLTLTVSDRVAKQAQSIAIAILGQTYQESRPKSGVRARLEAQLAEARSRFENARVASTGVLKRLGLPGGGVELVRGYAELLNATGTAQAQITALESQLDGLSEAQLIQPPTLPQKSSQPKKGMIAIGATLATGLALMLFVFMRQAWRNAAKNHASSTKLARIRHSLGLK